MTELYDIQKTIILSIINLCIFFSNLMKRNLYARNIFIQGYYLANHKVEVCFTSYNNLQKLSYSTDVWMIWNRACFRSSEYFLTAFDSFYFLLFLHIGARVQLNWNLGYTKRLYKFLSSKDCVTLKIIIFNGH